MTVKLSVPVKEDRANYKNQVEVSEKEQARLTKIIEGNDEEISNQKKEIEKLKQGRLDDRIAVLGVRTEDEVLVGLTKAFPKIFKAKFAGVTEIVDPATGYDYKYILVPAFAATTFVTEHNNLVSYKAETARYGKIGALYDANKKLSNDVLRLENEKYTACVSVYEDAFEKYRDLNDKYIQQLKNPPSVEFKPPSVWTFLGGAVLGIAGCL